MRRRLVRVATVVVATVAMLGSVVPPASATTVGTVRFLGTMSVGQGISNPCIGNGGVIDTTKCPTPTFSVKPKPAPKHGNDLMVNYSPGPTANTATTSVGSTTCLGTFANANKFGKPATEIAPCSFGWLGTIQGSCGLATGLVTGTMSMGLTQTYDFLIKYTQVGQTLIINGRITKRTGGRTGWIKGTVRLLLLTLGSCNDKGSKLYLVDGDLSVKILNPV